MPMSPTCGSEKPKKRIPIPLPRALNSNFAVRACLRSALLYIYMYTLVPNTGDGGGRNTRRTRAGAGRSTQYIVYVYVPTTI